MNTNPEGVQQKTLDNLGSGVRTLADEVQEVGYKGVVFNASDLASGALQIQN